MLAIGLTGGIGTGKSEVSRILGEQGAAVIDADRVGHEVYSPHTPGWRALVEGFGEGILHPAGEVDRKRLGTIVFSDPQARKKLNSILHPRIAEVIRERMVQLRLRGTRVVVVEAALLVEAGWSSLVDEIWVTCSEEGEVLERLRGRNSLSESEIRDRISSQLPQEEKAKHAHVRVRNSGSLEDLRGEVSTLLRNTLKGRGA